MREPLRSKPPAFATLKPSSDTKELDASLAALNKSAERLQTLWFSFLFVTLYFAISALTTTHLQLLLEKPKQLPIVNLTVPLLSFFVIAPAFYVVIHVYFLMMLVLLARTACGFEAQLQKALPALGKQEAFRLRVENALFLQLLSGMDEERGGMNGRVLAGVALFTLAIAPVLVLLLFQFMFLPYQHLALTWWHRVLVIVDLAAIVVLWSAYRRGDGMVSARGVVSDWSRKGLVGRVASGAVLCFAGYATLLEGRWAGEPAPWQCKVWQVAEKGLLGFVCTINADPARLADTSNGRMFGLFPDRLRLRNATIVGQKLFDEKRAETTALGDNRPMVTRTFDGRNFVGAVFDSSDLRGVSFSNAQLQSALLIGAQLQGASLTDAQLQSANVWRAELQGASLVGAQLQGAVLDDAQLQGASLERTELQGASLEAAQLQGALLEGAQLQGARLYRAQLQGASLDAVRLQGASLLSAQLEGASFEGAQLQGAILDSVSVFGARGISLRNDNMAGVLFSVHSIYRVQNARADEVLLTQDIVERWKRAALEHQRHPRARERIEMRFLDLAVLLDNTAAAEAEEERWRAVKDVRNSREAHARRHVEELTNVACTGPHARHTVRRLLDESAPLQLLRYLVEAREGQVPCEGVAALRDNDWDWVLFRLRSAASSAQK